MAFEYEQAWASPVWGLDENLHLTIVGWEPR
jgi:hypothetical protein